ncbi:hypothetical protein FACS18942_03220 [Planctomycetales bacterium]|nr:hypothetical protein FACS18942_03220 [Planctomycetales bacterium]
MENEAAGFNPRKLVFVDESGAKLLYLPPYSPDLNPIENSFAKENSLLRKAEIRDVDKLLVFLKQSLQHFTPNDCKGYFKHCGYRKQKLGLYTGNVKL